jgi:hypothetical protein
MTEPEGELPAPEHESPPREGELAAPLGSPSPEAAPAGAAYLPFGAYAPPSTLVASKPAWTRTYELPTARSVVSAGLQLSLASTVPIRRASIYIGLLSLGAVGPAVILMLVGLARLLSDPITAAILNSDDPTRLFFEQPALSGPLTLISIVGLVGLLLIIAISIDAKAIAIAMLGGAAAESPVALPETITRARQTFWRLLGSGLLVGVVSSVISLVLAWPFLRPFDTNQGVTFITSMIGTLLVTPFAYASTGIVLGDAGAIESLRRSMRLFRARPRIALVVTLFTLVSAAIQNFALSGGADLAYRVATFFHAGEGAASLILPGILVLALIVAFGSLTFTIAAIVAAPQVAAFLGLTFYSAGLDRARSSAGASPRVRWVSVPMAIVMVGLALVAALGIPTIVSFQPRPARPLLQFLRDVAAGQREGVTALGTSSGMEDPTHDVRGLRDDPSADIVAADAGWLPSTPRWLVEAFHCGEASIACGSGGVDDRVFEGGAFLYLQRMLAGPEAIRPGHVFEWGPMFALVGESPARAVTNRQFSGSNFVYLTRTYGTQVKVVLMWHGDEFDTAARSRWQGDELITIIPAAELDGPPATWDVYAAERGTGGSAVSLDTLRSLDDDPLLPFQASMFLAAPTLRP